MARIIGFAGGAFVNVNQGGDDDGRIVLGINDVIIAVKTPDETLRLTFDFEDELEDGVTLASVAYTVPTGISGSAESTDTAEGTSDIDISVGTHGRVYVLALTATLSDSSTITRNWPIRVFNG